MVQQHKTDQIASEEIPVFQISRKDLAWTIGGNKSDKSKEDEDEDQVAVARGVVGEWRHLCRGWPIQLVQVRTE